MRISGVLSTLLLASALACNHENIARQEGNASLPFTFTPGDDPPADPATISYFVNHVGINVANLTRTSEWYSRIIGMRHIFTIDLEGGFSIMYMAHNQGGRNGTGFQTGAEMQRDKNNMAGMIEFQSYTGSGNSNSTGSETQRPQRPRAILSHFGLIVPNVEAAQARFESLGVRIIKRAGEIDLTGQTEESRLLGAAWGFADLSNEETQKDAMKAAPGLEVIGFRTFLIIADPDGNMLEVQQQSGAAI
ncbi:lactoylglutathione lyase [Paraphaeosphaeria sporulosa]